MASLKKFIDRCVLNEFYIRPQIASDYPQFLEETFSRDLVTTAQNTIESWASYEKTPLHLLTNLAETLGVGEILYKDESQRFGLGSFKALGGAYAVESILSGRDAPSVTVATATDGNHGRSVAWGAQKVGCGCVIFIHSEVSKGREDAMAALGAKVVRIDGDYDASVRACSEVAEENGWEIISDTSWEGYRETPTKVMSGYSVMVREILSQAEQMPTHIIIQAGVGGLAGSVSAAFWQALGDQLPHITIVESKHAPCLIKSAKTGNVETVEISEETIMAGLSCGETSAVAWNILSRAAQLFVTIGDQAVPEGMRALNNGHAGPKIEAGECALPGIIALAAILKNQELASKIGLNENSRVLVFGCEGATDLEIHSRVMSGEIE